MDNFAARDYLKPERIHWSVAVVIGLTVYITGFLPMVYPSLSTGIYSWVKWLLSIGLLAAGSVFIGRSTARDATRFSVANTVFGLGLFVVTIAAGYLSEVAVLPGLNMIGSIGAVLVNSLAVYAAVNFLRPGKIMGNAVPAVTGVAAAYFFSNLVYSLATGVCPVFSFGSPELLVVLQSLFASTLLAYALSNPLKETVGQGIAGFESAGMAAAGALVILLGTVGPLANYFIASTPALTVYRGFTGVYGWSLFFTGTVLYLGEFSRRKMMAFTGQS